MTSTNLISAPDIIQAEHENDANAKRIVGFGKTTSGEYIEIQVDSNGVIQIG